MAPSPCRSDSRCFTPMSSGSSKSGSTLPTFRPLLISTSSLITLADLWRENHRIRPELRGFLSRGRVGVGSAAHQGARAVDARGGRDVEVLAGGAAPRQVVRRLRELQQAEALPGRAQHPDAAG